MTPPPCEVLPAHQHVPQRVPLYSLWEHFKGHRYLVTGYIYDSESGCKEPPEIAYQCLSTGVLWHRPIDGEDGFLTPKKNLDGSEVERFRFLGMYETGPSPCCFILDDNGDY